MTGVFYGEGEGSFSSHGEGEGVAELLDPPLVMPPIVWGRRIESCVGLFTVLLWDLKYIVIKWYFTDSFKADTRSKKKKKKSLR